MCQMRASTRRGTQGECDGGGHRRELVEGSTKSRHMGRKGDQAQEEQQQKLDTAIDCYDKALQLGKYCASSAFYYFNILLIN